ncbi:hypothetical protein IFM89_021205 [Coptis chinensis]|uniref:Cucumisin n=1 Tax=Coptis chinensis TaxID=261450 RepID=A0A835HIX5_9MAGN|nr:hypothetical protein IFM89_021205 [Coptis chinensis]
MFEMSMINPYELPRVHHPFRIFEIPRQGNDTESVLDGQENMDLHMQHRDGRDKGPMIMEVSSPGRDVGTTLKTGHNAGTSNDWNINSNPVNLDTFAPRYLGLSPEIPVQQLTSLPYTSFISTSQEMFHNPINIPFVDLSDYTDTALGDENSMHYKRQEIEFGIANTESTELRIIQHQEFEGSMFRDREPRHKSSLNVAGDENSLSSNGNSSGFSVLEHLLSVPRNTLYPFQTQFITIPDCEKWCGQVKGDEALLNYPSMTSYAYVKQPFHKIFPRKVTNVGSATSTYKATISEQPLLNITVTPSILTFKALNEQQDFVVYVTGGVFETKAVISASLTWSDGVHSVRSPIVVIVKCSVKVPVNTYVETPICIYAVRHMNKLAIHFLVFFVLTIFCCLFLMMKIYIVYMGAQTEEGYSLGSELHLSALEQVLEGSSPQESLVYSYKNSFNGFAAWLTDKEKNKLLGTKGVVSVFLSKTHHPQTTRSWDFLAFPSTVNRIPDVESNIIVGVIDTGIWPESLSFNASGIGPPPSKWKGTCHNFTCNNKIIGAKFYKADGNFSSEEKSPRDIDGHGTHVASTIAGREVEDVSFFGITKGTVRGAVPSARIAVYKVCFDWCQEHDILAGLHDAISDGVDVISISLGHIEQHKAFSDNAIAIGSFHAMQKGILVSASTGNFGPGMKTLRNDAPWILSTGASTIDRRIISNVELGNNMTLEASSCSIINGTRGAFEAGALGAVVVTNKTQEIAFSFPLPATVISNNPDRSKILIYLNTTSDPTAIIYQGEAAYDSSAPSVASFSSRGPSTVTPLILKPDISAPGVGILAAWSPKGLFSNVKGDKRSVAYNIKSGTSMACPHVTGAAIYVKTYHPTWSPAAIKSALMTTASPMKNVDPTRGEFAYGAGQVNPVKAVDPGLVYDISENDYVEMLCDKHYSVDALKVITGRNVTCGQVEGDESLLNYPSMTSYVNTKQPFHKYFPRKVTNVGSACSTYKAIISEQPQLNITVTPSILSFKSMNEQQDFAVNITGGVFETNAVVSASLTWSDGVHSVRSPIVVLVEVNEISIINT